MVNPREKGARGERLVRDLLRQYTDLQFERVPQSGALEYLKGDLYVPHAKNKYCIEVKNYAESPFSDKIFTQEKTCKLKRWWTKLVKEAANGEQKPLLFFKYNRSPVFVMTRDWPEVVDKFTYISWLDSHVMLAEEWLIHEKVEFING